MRASICLATFKKPDLLADVLNSIAVQEIPFDYEIIVVDDGNDKATENVCKNFPQVKLIQVKRDPVYRNPSVARNLAYREARGDVVICQSDDVIHITLNSVERLVLELQPKTFSIATVYNTDKQGHGIPWENYLLTGPTCQRPFFFLGVLLRSDLYAVGGNDERYTSPGYDDDAFGNALVYGLGLKANYVDVVGHHIDHERPNNLGVLVEPSKQQYQQFYSEQVKGLRSWLSPGAPWLYEKDAQ
jgi:glycosyltransferase involved in cell wall biosynthesis